MDGGPWRPARLIGPNLPGAWARWRFVWDATPGVHQVRVRAADEAGNVQHQSSPWNDLGYLYGGIVEHPIDVR